MKRTYARMNRRRLEDAVNCLLSCDEDEARAAVAIVWATRASRDELQAVARAAFDAMPDDERRLLAEHVTHAKALS